MIDSLAIWRAALIALPKVSDSSWAANFAAFVADRISPIGAADGKGIETDPTILTLASPPPLGLIFTFPQATFATSLQVLTPTEDPVAGIAGFADAWANSMSTIVFPATLNVLMGAFVPPSTPATLFSSITAVTIDPASLIAAKAKISELASSTPVADANNSDFPVKFREAFLLLTITVVGLNSIVPTPTPLTVANVPLI